MPYLDPARRRANNLKRKRISHTSALALALLARLTRGGTGAATATDIHWHPIVMRGLISRGLAEVADADLDLYRATPAGLTLADALARDSSDTRLLRERIHALELERDQLLSERHRLQELVDDLTLQSTEGMDGTCDSRALTAYANGLRDMAARGRVRITHDVGRRVIAEPVPPTKGGAS